MSRYDLVVLGSGPAGQKAAIAAAKLGRTVAVVERNAEVGGGCIHHGTIPSKTLREVVSYPSGVRQRQIYGTAYRVAPASPSSPHSGSSSPAPSGEPSAPATSTRRLAPTCATRARPPA